MSTTNHQSYINKPKINNLKAICMTKDEYNLVLVRLDISQREIPNISIPGFHPTNKKATFYLGQSQEVTFKDAFQKVPVLSVDVDFNNYEGKTIGYFPPDRDSNIGGGNVKITSIPPQNMQELFNNFNYGENNINYIAMPELKFYKNIENSEILAKVIQYDFSCGCVKESSDDSIHLFVDNEFLNTNTFPAITETCHLYKRLLSEKRGSLHPSVIKYLDKEPTLFGVHWIYNCLNKKMHVHICQKNTMMLEINQYAFGIKSDDTKSMFSEFLEFDTTEPIVFSSSNNYQLKTFARSNGRINLETMHDIKDSWLIALVKGKINNVKILDNQTNLEVPDDHLVEELQGFNVEESMRLYKISETISEISDEESITTKNDIMLSYASDIVKVMHCKEKRVRFKENNQEEVHPIQIICKQFEKSAKDNFIGQIHRLEEYSTPQQVPILERQASCGIPRGSCTFTARNVIPKYTDY